jgi:hypothetical protein
LERGGVTILDGVKDELPLTNFDVADIVKPRDYQNFNPTNNAIEFGSRTLKTRGYKADLQIFPLEFEKTWLAHNVRRARTIKNAEDIPFYQYIIDRIMLRVQDNLRRATFRGVYNGSGSSLLDICDGFVTLMKADVVAGNIQTVTLGAITPSNVVTALESMALQIKASYYNSLMFMHVPAQVFDLYVTSTENGVGRSMQFNEFNQRAEIFLRVANVKLVRNIDLVHTDEKSEVFVSIDNNLMAGTNTVSDMNNIEFEKFERSIKMMIDGTWGVEYALANTEYNPIICSEAFV